MYRIEYTTYNGFDNVKWADLKPDAERIAAGLRKLKHVSNVRVNSTEQQHEVGDRFMLCPQCEFGCRMSQMPRSFTLDADEHDNPWVLCKHYKTPEKCTYRKLHNTVYPPHPGNNRGNND